MLPCLQSRLRIVTLAVITATCCSTAYAAEWRPTLSATGGLTMTDNVALAPEGRERSDVILRLTPRIGLNRDGARLKVRLNYSPTLLYYFDTPTSDNLSNNLNATAKLEAVEDFFFVDASAVVTQTFVSPFAPQSADVASTNPNRVERQVYRISPYIQRRTASGIEYLVRDDASYTTTNNPQLPDLQRNRFLASVQSNPETFAVWRGEYTNFDNQLPNRRTQSGQIARAQVTLKILPDFQIYPIVGYETNNYGLSEYSGAVYGGGVKYTPTPRTQFRAQAEQRFFGTSYDVGLTHRTRSTSWDFRAYKTLTYWEAPLFTLPVGDAESSLDQILRTRIPDPAERQQAVDSFLERSGVPELIQTPYQFFTTQLFTRQGLQASTGLLGVRNSVLFRVFLLESVPVTNDPTGIADAFSNFNRIRTRGASVSASHQLTGRTRIGADITRTYNLGNSVATTGAPTIASTQTIFRVNLSHQLGPDTFGTLGVRYQIFDRQGLDAQERAILATITHRFF